MQTNYMQALAPELVVAVVGVLCLAAGMLRGPRAAGAAKPLALLGLLAGAVIALSQSHAAPSGTGELYVDTFSTYVRVALCGVGAIVVLSAWALPAVGRISEMFALLLFSVAGAMLVASADDLILLFFALELVSVPTYAMVAAGSNNSASQEAGLKYFFLGALSSAIMVYGFSFLYGAAGTTTLLGAAGATSIAAGIQAQAANPFAALGLVLALLGLAYKVAAVPMHFYVADVYQGAAAPISGMLSFVPKFAGLIAMMKILALIGWPLNGTMYWMIWLMAAATMTVGNALALLQDNVKRMLAYSSVAHSGYMLVGLLIGPALAGNVGPLQDGLAAVLYYIVAYGIMNIGAFTVIAYLTGKDGQEPQLLQSLSGLGRLRPGVALALALCVFSLLGIPPTAGFFGKVYLFGSALSLGQGSPYQLWTNVLVVLALLNTAVSSGYYLRIIGAAYYRAPEGPAWPKGAAPVGVALVLCSVLVLLIGLRPSRLADPAGQASRAAVLATHRPAPAPAVLPTSVAAIPAAQR